MERRGGRRGKGGGRERERVKVKDGGKEGSERGGGEEEVREREGKIGDGSGRDRK